MSTVQDTFVTAPLWDNPALRRYHGTTRKAAEEIAAGQISVEAGLNNKDFGRGFYTTTVLAQAKEWARGTPVRKGKMERPAVACLEVSRIKLSELGFMGFVVADKASEDFWSFTRYCRRQPPHRRPGRTKAVTSHDVIFGPLVWSWQSRVIFPGRDQVSFHTKRAESFLNKHVKKTIITSDGSVSQSSVLAHRAGMSRHIPWHVVSRGSAESARLSSHAGGIESRST